MPPTPQFISPIQVSITDFTTPAIHRHFKLNRTQTEHVILLSKPHSALLSVLVATSSPQLSSLLQESFLFPFSLLSYHIVMILPTNLWKPLFQLPRFRPYVLLYLNSLLTGLIATSVLFFKSSVQVTS